MRLTKEKFIIDEYAKYRQNTMQRDNRGPTQGLVEIGRTDNDMEFTANGLCLGTWISIKYRAVCCNLCRLIVQSVHDQNIAEADLRGKID